MPRTGPRVLITGASSGIGAALARCWARQGARLTLMARRTDRLAAVAAECAALGGEALTVTGDVTVDGDDARAVAAAVERFGGLDIAVANAGFGVIGRIDALALADLRRQFETNVFGAWRTVQAALPALTASRGRLALMGSVMGHLSMANAAPYAMSKFALRALADALRLELLADGVSVTLLSPGFVDSEIRRVDNHGRLRAAAVDDVPGRFRMPADTAARQMVRAVARRRREAVITWHGRVGVLLARHWPWLVWQVLRRTAGRRRSFAQDGA